MLFLMEQRLVFMLSVQIDQKTRDLPQPCSRYRLVVDAADAPGRCDFLRND